MLTKSDLLSMNQCPRRLWLEKNRPELIPTDDPSLYRRAVDGRIVGQRANENIPIHPDFPRGENDLEHAAELARRWLTTHPGVSAVEVPMASGALYARADALLARPGSYVLRETKASTFPLKSDKVTPDAAEDYHLLDLAIQLWVMEASGIPCAGTELNLLNNQWRYGGDGDYSGLFRIMDVTEKVRNLKKDVPAFVEKAEAILAGKLPDLNTSSHCHKPHPCPFLAHCQKLDPPGPEHPIEVLPDLAGKNLARKLKQEKGYVSILDPTPEELTGKQAALYRRIQEAHRKGEAILDPKSSALLGALPYPRYFFDFEGIDLPVPRWQGARPYEQIPFQWSCHIERTPGQFEHEEFIDLSGNDPSPTCIARMIEVLRPETPGPIIVYHATYERSRINDFAERFPEHAGSLGKLGERLFDLLPVVKDHFYHPKMKGSFSIKKVLPVVVSDLSYDELGEVSEGTAAQVAYLYAAFDQGTSATRKVDLEAKLRKYCRQDTWAMVEIAYFLAGSGRPLRPRGM